MLERERRTCSNGADVLERGVDADDGSLKACDRGAGARGILGVGVLPAFDGVDAEEHPKPMERTGTNGASPVPTLGPTE